MIPVQTIPPFQTCFKIGDKVKYLDCWAFDSYRWIDGWEVIGYRVIPCNSERLIVLQHEDPNHLHRVINQSEYRLIIDKEKPHVASQ